MYIQNIYLYLIYTQNEKDTKKKKSTSMSNEGK